MGKKKNKKHEKSKTLPKDFTFSKYLKAALRLNRDVYIALGFDTEKWQLDVAALQGDVEKTGSYVIGEGPGPGPEPGPLPAPVDVFETYFDYQKYEQEGTSDLYYPQPPKLPLIQIWPYHDNLLFEVEINGVKNDTMTMEIYDDHIALTTTAGMCRLFMDHIPEDDNDPVYLTGSMLAAPSDVSNMRITCVNNGYAEV